MRPGHITRDYHRILNTPTSTHPLVNAPVGRSLARLATPAIIGVVIQSLISVTEAWYIGGIGKTALAGVALVFPLYMLATMLSAGAVGGAVSGATARALGAENNALARTILRTALVVAVIGAGLMTMLYLLFGAAFFRLLGGEGKVLEYALAYGDVLLPGIVAIWLYNMSSAVLRGSGDMIKPATAIFIVSCVHFVAAGVFIKGWGPIPALGIKGAAWGIIVAYLVGWAVLLVILRHRNARVRLVSGNVTREAITPIAKNGILASFQSMFTIAIALTTTALVARFGESWLAGYGIGVRLELLMVPVIFGFGSALIAITGANVGAGLRDRAIRIAWIGVTINAVMIGSIGLVCALFPSIWSDLFTDNADVAAACAAYLRIVGPFYVFFALGLCLYFASQGLGTLPIPVAGTVLRFTIVAIGGWYVVTHTVAKPDSLFWLFAAALVCYGLFISIGLRFGPWKTSRTG